MYRIVIEDNIDHDDPEFDTYEDAQDSYMSMLNYCMENGISAHISLWKVIDGECPANAYHCIAASSYLAHTFD